VAATDDDDVKKPRGPKWRAMSGTTLALTSLAVLGAAAVASTPVWLYYRRKRRRTDALASAPTGPPSTVDTPPTGAPPPGGAPGPPESGP
jgi:hypothetical protein